jgi:hypothetical protein
MNNLLFVLKLLKENTNCYFKITYNNSIFMLYFYKGYGWRLLNYNYAIITYIDPIKVYNLFQFHKCKIENNDTDFYDVFASDYSPKDLSAKIILKYWKRYRWNYRKNKIDPLKKELIEYIYHPSRINFNL